MKRVRVYTNEKFIPKDKKLVKSNDIYFNVRVTLEMESLQEIEKQFMYKIDKAVLQDEDSTRIKTPFGECYLTDLSTGCKTALNIVNPNEGTDNIFSLSECSSDVAELLVNWIADNKPEQAIYISTLELSQCDDIEFIVDNDKQFIGGFSMMGYICRTREGCGN